MPTTLVVWYSLDGSYSSPAASLYLDAGRFYLRIADGGHVFDLTDGPSSLRLDDVQRLQLLPILSVFDSHHAHFVERAVPASLWSVISPYFEGALRRIVLEDYPSYTGKQIRIILEDLNHGLWRGSMDDYTAEEQAYLSTVFSNLERLLCTGKCSVCDGYSPSLTCTADSLWVSADCNC